MPQERPAKSPEPAGHPAAVPRADQDYFAQSFRLSPAVMLLARLPDAELIEVNDAFTRITGFSREEVLGHTTLSLGLWTHLAQREQFMKLIRGEKKVREFEAEFIPRDGGARRWMSLTADVVEIEGHPCMLTVGIDVTDRRRRDLFQETTYRISEAASAPGDLQALFAKLHQLIGGLMPARNLYFALLSPDGAEISFPYFEDEQTPRPGARPRGRSLTDFVLNTGQSLLARKEELHRKLHEQGYAAVGMPSCVWLGAPLVSGGRPIGVVALQDYRDERFYDEEARRLLTFVAEQAAAAVERRRAEDALRRSEDERRASQEYFVRSFQASPAMMAIARLADGKLLEANTAFFTNSGYSRPEAIGRTTTELGIWPRPEDRAALLKRIMAEGSVRNYEAVFLNRSGQQRFVIVSADTVEFSGEGCYIVTAVDITERHHRERVQDATYRISRVVLAGGDLRDLFAELHRIVAGLMPAQNFYVGVLDPAQTRLSFPYFADETAPPEGFVPPPRALGLGFTDYVIETMQPQLLTADELAGLMRARGPYEPPLPSPAVRLGAPLVVDGRAIGVIAIHDYKNPGAYGPEEKRLLTFVAEQAAAAIERRRAEMRYRSIFENALEGLYTSTPEGRFLNVNPAFARMLGYPAPADLVNSVANIGRQFYVEPGRRDEFFRLLSDADAVTDFESEVYASDGRRLWISESVRAVRDETGRLDHLEGVAVDVTVQRETALALQAAKEAADAASRAKSQFLASMSHELRTPLNGILGYTQILRRDAGLDQRQRGGVDIINQSAEHLLALINDVLDLARIEAHRLELHPLDFDLPDFARAAGEFFMLRAREKSLHLETVIAADLPRFVRGDIQRLRQVCYNLLGNAVKFTQRGSVIFSVERAGDRVRFSVSDTGPGIAPADQLRLFEPFAQIGDQTRHAEGTGLGLNVSRGIVEQMGGRLLIDSQAGWGSRFHFDLLLPPGAPGCEPPAPVAASRITGYIGPRRRVLVADDHAPNRQLLRDLLEPLGFEVREAEDGAAAVAQAKAWRPDFVALDLKMPQLDGWAAARAIRAVLPAETTHLVAMSASAFDSDRQAALDAGCEEFLAKPLREGELLGVMERLLDLVWEYADTAATPGTVSPFPAVEYQPEIADADAIHELASKGDVVGVRTYAQRLAERDPRLAPFAQTITSLAHRFKMKAIRQFVARYRADGTARPFPLDPPPYA